MRWRARNVTPPQDLTGSKMPKLQRVPEVRCIAIVRIVPFYQGKAKLSCPQYSWFMLHHILYSVTLL